MSRQLNQAQIGRNTTIITHEAASVTHHTSLCHAPTLSHETSLVDFHSDIVSYI